MKCPVAVKLIVLREQRQMVRFSQVSGQHLLSDLLLEGTLVCQQLLLPLTCLLASLLQPLLSLRLQQ